MVKYKDTEDKKQSHFAKRIKKQKKRYTKNKSGQPTKPFNKNKYRQFKEKLKPEIFFYKCDVPIRTEELPPFAKQMQSKVVEREFKKESSVFSKWRMDTPASVQ